MFGYVVANQDDLTPQQMERYRGAYCGLCKTLGQRHGFFSRMSLTYDMTFLVVLLSSLYEPPAEQGTERCALHPAKAHPYWRNEITDYAADMNVALAYYNSMDDWRDDHNLGGLAQAKLLKAKCDEILQHYPRQMRAIQYSLKELTRLEKARTAGPDEAAACFGTLMGELFVLKEDHWSTPLRRMGIALGKFIYILDACDDLPEDRRTGGYNPLLSMDGDDFLTRCREILTMLIAEAAAEFEKLPIVEDAALLRNILYSGVWSKFTALEAKQKTRSKGDTKQHEQ